MVYRSVFQAGVHGPLGVHRDWLKGSTRPIEKVHDLLLAVLSSTEVQKCRGTVTWYFLVGAYVY